LAQAKGLALRLHVVPGVMSDPLLLRRVVGNLISNAIKYTDSGGILIASRNGHRPAAGNLGHRGGHCT
jgi:signal transduction histidine kinase